jgi:serine protease Do
VRYPYLGVMVGDVSGLEPEKKTKLGSSVPERAAYVSEVTPNGPAASAGLRAGDVITQIDGQKIEAGADVVDYVSSQSIGTKVKVAYLRDGKQAATTVALGELPGSDEQKLAQAGGKLGLGLQTITPEIAGSLGLPRELKGAVITEVAPGSAAERAGLKEGEAVVEVDRKPVATAEEAATTLKAPRPGGHLVRVRGLSGARYVTVPAP